MKSLEVEFEIKWKKGLQVEAMDHPTETTQYLKFN
jgi:hypothetical protein